MEGKPDIHAGTERLRSLDPEATESFLFSWMGPVHRYCATVCAPELVAAAVEAAFADFFEKIQSYPIDDEHLEPALRRCTRLAAAERAIVDERIATAESNGGLAFDCKTTPLFLAGSPKVRAGVRVLDRMRDHMAACPRCQATESRFRAAEDNFQDEEPMRVPDELLEAVLGRFSPSGTRTVGREEPDAGQVADAVTVPGFTTLSLSESDAQRLTVYAVLDRDTDQPATLWMAPEERDPQLAARFLHDARLLAQVSHSSVPGVRAVGETREGAYLVTDALQGRSLLSVIGSGLLSDRTLRMLGEVADGLDAVHGVGLLHGQVRPRNILVGKWLVAHPVLVDFALGREVAADGPQAPYMAPEQRRGEAAGPPADLYALACTLFEFLTGAPPFGLSPDAAQGHRDEPPPRLGGDLPRALDAVFERALAKDPDQRLASAAALVSDVARALSPSRPADVSPPAPKPEPAAEAGEEPEATPGGEEEPESEPEEVTEPDDATEPEDDPDPEPAEMPRRTVVIGAGAETDQLAKSDSAMEAADIAGNQREGPEAEGFRLSLKVVLLASALAAGALVALLIVLAGGSSERDDASSEGSSSAPVRSTRQPARPEPRKPALVPMPLGAAKATDFDPNGGNGERPNEVGRVIDGNPGTAWQTELYPTGRFGKGVGVYIALPRAQKIRTVTLRTSTPGWDAEIYGASAGPPAGLPAAGWTKLGGRASVRTSERIQLTGPPRPIRFCLVWITTLPPKGVVSIGEVGLLAER